MTREGMFLFNVQARSTDQAIDAHPSGSAITFTVPGGAGL